MDYDSRCTSDNVTFLTLCKAAADNVRDVYAHHGYLDAEVNVSEEGTTNSLSPYMMGQVPIVTAVGPL